MYLFLIILLMFSFMLLIMLQVLLIRVFTMNYFKSFMVSFSLVFILHIVGLYLLLEFNIYTIRYFFGNIIIFSGLSYIYLSIVTLGETSIRFKLINELYENDGKSELNDFAKDYKGEGLINIRLKRMLENKLLINDSKYYYCNSRFWYFVSKFILLMKILILKKKSQFE